MGTSTGVDDVLAGKAASLANSDGKDLMNELEKGFNNILQTYELNWGTDDGKKWVEGQCQSTMNSLSEAIAASLTSIEQTIANTANDDLAQSGNSQRVTVPDAIAKKTFTAHMNDKLSDGHVGVYIELPELAESAGTACQNGVNAAIGKLQSDVIPKVEAAFRESGSGSKVYSDIMAAISSIQSSIETAMADFASKVKSSAENADQFASNIQAKGASGN